MKKTNSKNPTLPILTLIILILFTNLAVANFIDLGHKNGLDISATFKAYKAFYVRAHKDELGVGAGVKTGGYFFLASVDKSAEAYNIWAGVVYNDKKLQYSIDLSGGFDNELRVTAGIGYPFTEKLSAYTKLSDDGLFLGIRRWF